MTTPQIDVMVSILEDAIARKAGVEFFSTYQRQVSPHLLGLGKDGRVVLQAYQYGGETSSGPVKEPNQGGWRYFYLDEMSPHISTLPTAKWYPEGEIKKSEKKSFITKVIAVVQP